MIKDIVVNLSVGEGGGSAGDYAVSVAGALWTRTSPASRSSTTRSFRSSATGYIPAEVIETQQADNEAAAKAAIDRFAEAADARRRRRRAAHAQPPASPAPASSSAASPGASISPSSARPSRKRAPSKN